MCAAALLRHGTTSIQDPGRSTDDAAALRIVEELGATVEQWDSLVCITSSGVVKPRTGTIDCGESGLAARLFAPIAALADVPVEIHGRGSLLGRPMAGVADTLREFGVVVSTREGYLPIVVHGPLQPRTAVVDGTQSSQIVSGILFALAASATAPVALKAVGLVSRPYLEMSCEVLRTFDWNVRFDGIETCFIEPALRHSHNLCIDTEDDWSSIAPMAVAASFGGSGIEIDGWRSDYQADASILDILSRAGSNVEEDEYRVCCSISPAPLRAFSVECTHSPDLIPILTILAAACNGRSQIYGLHRLVHKESNRANTTSALLTSLGIDYAIKDDAFVIWGPQTPRSAIVQSHNDHRIVMAAAIAALRADGPVTIEGAEAVSKSYPAFFQDLQSLGVTVQLHDS